MELFRPLLYVHIAAGIVALAIAPGAMITRKGGLWHRRWGKIYFGSMAIVTTTAVWMSLIRSGLFLLLIALFSFYLAFTGYRALYRTRPGGHARWFDWSVAVAILLASAGLTAWGASVVRDASIGIVAMVFGVVGGSLATRDLRRFRNPPADPRAWWFEHMTGMLAAYIATVSAFSVVNFTFLPTVVRWLWPTVVGTAVISAWVTYYRRKFGARTAFGTP